jgi:3'-phosphoadenosine 5'-phosphosulfate sulfotransferase (PAPS reductase)/FAD synthetase
VTFWLSYGGGVNSTALAVLMLRGAFPQYVPWRILFADTGDERPETYEYIREHFIPYLQLHGKELEICYPTETVLDRWERLRVTGSRIIRACTENGKIVPMSRYRAEHGDGPVLLGIDASESHRRPDDIRPLVDANIDRD